MEPIYDPESECYGCEAGMCDHQICRGDQYHYGVATYVPDDDINVKPIDILKIRKKKIDKMLWKIKQKNSKDSQQKMVS